MFRLALSTLLILVVHHPSCQEYSIKIGENSGSLDDDFLGFEISNLDTLADYSIEHNAPITFLIGYFHGNPGEPSTFTVDYTGL